MVKVFHCTGFEGCDATFTRTEHLTRHIRKHTGDKPFQCHCGRSFTRIDNLRQHATTVHAQTPELNESCILGVKPIHSQLVGVMEKKVVQDGMVEKVSEEECREIRRRSAGSQVKGRGRRSEDAAADHKAVGMSKKARASASVSKSTTKPKKPVAMSKPKEVRVEVEVLQEPGGDLTELGEELAARGGKGLAYPSPWLQSRNELVVGKPFEPPRKREFATGLPAFVDDREVDEPEEEGEGDEYDELDEESVHENEEDELVELRRLQDEELRMKRKLYEVQKRIVEIEEGRRFKKARVGV